MLKPISALEALRAIDAELHMVTKYGPEVGMPYDTISAGHVHTAKTMLETLISAQKSTAFNLPRWELERVSDGYHHDHVMEPSSQGEWVKFEDVSA